MRSEPWWISSTDQEAALNLVLETIFNLCVISPDCCLSGAQMISRHLK